MDVSNPGFWIAIGVGGSVIAAMSFTEQYISKNPEESFRLRAVFRDFFIGAFLTAIVYMFLPESIQSWVSMGQNMISSSISKMTGGGSATTINSTSTSTSADISSSSLSEIELQFGPARF